MSDEFVKVENDEGVMVLTLHDPATRNAINPDMAQEFFEALDRFEDDSELRVLLLTGSRTFLLLRSQRARLQQQHPGQGGKKRIRVPQGPGEAWRPVIRAGSIRSLPHAPEMVLRLQEQQKPTIAAVNGHAIGAGMGLALACDVRLAAEKAIFSEAFVRMGLIPADGSCWNLPRLIGVSNTLLLQYTGDRVEGPEALRLGLVSQLVPDDRLMESALGLAHRIARGATRSQSLIKYLVRRAADQSFREHLDLAHVAQDQARTTEDHREAVQAFLDKRPPQFRGR